MDSIVLQKKKIWTQSFRSLNIYHHKQVNNLGWDLSPFFTSAKPTCRTKTWADRIIIFQKEITQISQIPPTCLIIQNMHLPNLIFKTYKLLQYFFPTKSSQLLSSKAIWLDHTINVIQNVIRFNKILHFHDDQCISTQNI